MLRISKNSRAPVTDGLHIGSLRFASRFIQGPLAGVSSAPFRALVWQHGLPAFCYTEMISCKTLLYASAAQQQRYIARDPCEQRLCYQLSSDEPQELAAAAAQVTRLGADLIDLNCGCPMKKIRRKGTGSRLLSTPTKLYELIYALKRSTSVPILVKIRVDARSHDRFNADVAQAVADAGADALVVHGRHWQEDYSVSCYYPDIAFFVERLPIPVIGNGDVADWDSCQRMLATGCAGVMIGRAGVGQPWLTRALQAAAQQQPFVVPRVSDYAAALLTHVSELARLLGSERQAVLEARQFAKYYARPVEDRVGFMQAMCACEDLTTLAQLVTEYFTSMHAVNGVRE